MPVTTNFESTITYNLLARKITAHAFTMNIESATPTTYKLGSNKHKLEIDVLRFGKKAKIEGSLES